MGSGSRCRKCFCPSVCESGALCHVSPRGVKACLSQIFKNNCLLQTVRIQLTMRGRVSIIAPPEISRSPLWMDRLPEKALRACEVRVIRGLAQSGSAPALGAGCRGFKSLIPDQFCLDQNASARHCGARFFSTRDESMVGVAQLVERRIVIPVVVGSIPIVHPIFPSSLPASCARSSAG